MLWRVRATLPDRPGALAALAQECGKAGVNIVGLQVFPGRDEVTDELVLHTPDDWSDADLVELVERSGGDRVLARACTEEALADQPTRYVAAAREVLGQPASFPDVVARLFDADVHPRPEPEDVMELGVGDVRVQIRRAAPFTAVEHARGSAMAALVSDVLAREAPAGDWPTARRMGSGETPDYVVDDGGVAALVDGVAVGRASVRDAGPEHAGAHAVDLEVDPAWRRRGIGTRLLADATRLARGQGAEEVVLTTAHDNRAVLPMVLAAGMRGRIRMSGETLTVRISVADLKPLR